MQEQHDIDKAYAECKKSVFIELCWCAMFAGKGKGACNIRRQGEETHTTLQTTKIVDPRMHRQ